MKQIRVIGSKEWSEMQVPDVYFSYEYYCASGRIELDFEKSILLEWKDERGTVYLPLILRKVGDTDYFDATSAYGYGGPWTAGYPSLAGFIEHFNKWASSNNILSTFLRFHPLIGNADAFSALVPLRVVGPTAGWNLQKTQALVEGMAKDHRKTFRRGQRSGVEVRLSVNPTQIDDFVRLYEMSMTRVIAKDFYRFSSSYWDSLRDDLGNSSVLVEAVFENRVVAAVWCLYGQSYLHYHLSGTSDEGRKLGGAVMCRLAAAEWGQRNGLTIAHSGGGLGGADSSLLSWKHKFDKDQPLYEFSVANLVHDEQLYAKVSEAYPKSDFFPPWRSPEARANNRDLID